MSDNMTKRAKEYMNADFVYEDYKNLAEAQKIACLLYTSPSPRDA